MVEKRLPDLLNRYAFVSVPTYEFGDVGITRRWAKDRPDWHHDYRYKQITPASLKRLARLLGFFEWSRAVDYHEDLSVFCTHSHWQPEKK